MAHKKFIFSICMFSSTLLFANFENKNTSEELNQQVIKQESQTADEQLNVEKTSNQTAKEQIPKQVEETIPFEVIIKPIVKEELRKQKKLLFTSRSKLKSYYKKNNYLPFWIDEKGIKDISLELLETIKNDPVIKPNATSAFKLDTVLNSLANIDKTPENYNASMLKIDFMLTEIYDKYMQYLSRGVINWKAFKRKLYILKKKDIIADWEKHNINVDTKALLVNAINENNLNLAFDKVNFTYPNADKLIHAIEDLQKVVENGDYTKIPSFDKSLKIGDKSETIKALRTRLFESKDLENLACEDTIEANDIVTNNIEVTELPKKDLRQNQTEIEVLVENTTTKEAKEIESTKTEEIVKKNTIDCQTIFDKELEEAVISFQKNHGLSADGVVGKNTRKFLNISAEKKINQIRLNLERMRWLPRNLGEKFLVVNIPDYKLKMYDKGEVKLDMNVVVGEKKHPTPVFSNEMSYIVLNPYWKIPKRIAQKELIPKLVSNPNYVNEKGIRIHEGWDPNSNQFDTYSINWQEYYAYLQNLEAARKNKVVEPLVVSDEILTLPNLRFIQIPSNNNPLGRIKFMFPNKYSVYMHDTPAKSLFKRTRRAYSHGCIRLADPKGLLKTISSYDSNVNYDRATEVLEDIEKKDIGLKNKIPVHIVYLTSWIDENGKLQFRDDIYKYDKMQGDLIF